MIMEHSFKHDDKTLTEKYLTLWLNNNIQSLHYNMILLITIPRL